MNNYLNSRDLILSKTVLANSLLCSEVKFKCTSSALTHFPSVISASCSLTTPPSTVSAIQKITVLSFQSPLFPYWYLTVIESSKSIRFTSKLDSSFSSRQAESNSLLSPGSGCPLGKPQCPAFCWIMKSSQNPFIKRAGIIPKQFIFLVGSCLGFVTDAFAIIINANIGMKGTISFKVN